MNNLLERLHASYFFYILTTPGTFLTIGSYLPSAILISSAMMFGGLSVWVDAGWTRVQTVEMADRKNIKYAHGSTLTWERRDRPVLNALLVMFATHAAGFFLFATISNGWSLDAMFRLIQPEGAPPINLVARVVRANTHCFVTCLVDIVLGHLLSIFPSFFYRGPLGAWVS